MEANFNKTQRNNNTNLQRINPEAGFKEELQSLNIIQHMKIIEQMSNSVCKIEIGNKIGLDFYVLFHFQL